MSINTFKINSTIKRLSSKTKNFRSALLYVFLFFGSSHCVGYLVQAGQGQLEIIWNTKPIKDVLNDPLTPKNVKMKLRLVEQAREFARESMGLNVDKTYQDISILDRKVLAWNVSASRPLSFTAKLHYFPIVGELPYLGYFSKAEAQKKAMQLQKEGWETLISEVGGYSTLGWFDDPLISTQLRFSDWYLVELVIHECTHATLWFPNNVRFNESFANFTGKQGAHDFFSSKYGLNSPIVKRRIKIRSEQKTINTILRKTTRKLNTIYKSNRSDQKKQSHKIKIIKKLRRKLVQLAPQFKYFNLKQISKKDFNNAYFLSFLRYKTGSKSFSLELNKCHKQWKCFFKRIKKHQFIEGKNSSLHE